nr:uncharacterized protein LOC118878243 isoform X2 [Drosophila suzukii]
MIWCLIVPRPITILVWWPDWSALPLPLATMKRQKYQSVVFGAPNEEADQVEEEEAEDSGGEVDEEGEADILVDEDYLEESISDDATDNSEALESIGQQDTQTEEVPPLEIAELNLDEPTEVASAVPEPRTKREVGHQARCHHV